MNYEPAKELKDAGFPQSPSGTYWTKDGIHKILAYEEHDKDELGLAYTPTLSELIEACGRDFEALDYVSNNTWMAVGNGHTVMGCSNPEEAVARLWLALNKKDI